MSRVRETRRGRFSVTWFAAIGSVMTWKGWAQEKPGQTLQPTALVHEAFLRIAGQDGPTAFANR